MDIPLGHAVPSEPQPQVAVKNNHHNVAISVLVRRRGDDRDYLLLGFAIAGHQLSHSDMIYDDCSDGEIIWVT